MNKFDINSFLEDLRKKHFIENLVLFLLGAFLSAFAFSLFYQRYSIVVGGSSGLAILLDSIMNVDISIILLILNLFCLMIGLMFLGFDYGIKMLAITFLTPIFVKGSSYIANLIDLGNTSLFLIAVIGGALTGYANGLIKNSGYSPGGFYAIYDACHKYLHISIGTANTLINVVLILLGGLTFGMHMAIYSIIALLVSSYIVDKVTIGVSDNKVFYIITDNPVEVQEYVNDKLNYDVTLVNARGGYSNKKKKMLMSVIPTLEYVKLKELVKEVDKNAFFLILDTYESTLRKKYRTS